MSPPRNSETFVPKRFPRVSGDEPRIYAVVAASSWFSPRERG